MVNTQTNPLARRLRLGTGRAEPPETIRLAGLQLPDDALERLAHHHRDLLHRPDPRAHQARSGMARRTLIWQRSRITRLIHIVEQHDPRHTDLHGELMPKEIQMPVALGRRVGCAPPGFARPVTSRLSRE